MAVVRGAKVFKLFDPLQSSILYHGTPLEHSQYNATVLDIGNNFSIAVNRILLNRTRLKSLPASETAKMALNISSYSPINLRRPDLKSFPDFSKASSVHTCTCIFNPSRYIFTFPLIDWCLGYMPGWSGWPFICSKSLVAWSSQRAGRRW